MNTDLKQVTLLILAIVGCGVQSSSPPATAPPQQPQEAIAQPAPNVTPAVQRQPEPAPPAKPSTQTPATSTASVRVMVHDGTESSPLGERAEIWVRGHGSWFLNQVTVKHIGGRKVGEKDTIAIYPDGRQGVEMIAPFMVTGEMNPQGSVRDGIHVTITDRDVTVFGVPIKAATDDFEMKFDR